MLVYNVFYSVSTCGSPTQIHTMHQSLRDLRCDQQRMSDDLDREILRRNRYLRDGAKSEHQNSKLVCFLFPTYYIHSTVRN